jgi:hypothetical protein
VQWRSVDAGAARGMARSEADCSRKSHGVDGVALFACPATPVQRRSVDAGAARGMRQQDPEVFAAIRNEEHRQRFKLEMIASENYTSPAVLEAVGSVLTNKYAEGYPGARYYGGCEWVDVIENLARDRAVQLFGGEHANVQPHAGAQANRAGTSLTVCRSTFPGGSTTSSPTASIASRSRSTTTCWRKRRASRGRS